MTKELLFSVSVKDCRVEAIASTHGAGGQNKNRRHTAIRITHPPSGAVGSSADERDQLQNKRVAFRRLAETKQFLTWVKLKSAELATGKTLEERVEDEMAPEKIKVEVRNAEGRWVDEP